MSSQARREPPYIAIVLLLSIIAVAVAVSASIAFADWNARRVLDTPEGRAADAMRRALGK